jgi:hypothetical protein
VGKSQEPLRRLKEHKLIFGFQTEMSIIDEVDSSNTQEWAPLEKKWITIYQYSTYNVLNKNNGGGGPNIKLKPIWATNMNNNKIYWFSSPKDASYTLSISHSGIEWALKHKTQSGGYYWIYDKNIKWPSEPINYIYQNEWIFRP